MESMRSIVPRDKASRSRAARTASTLTHQVAVVAVGSGRPLSSRFTIAKFQALDEYIQSTTLGRRAAVLLITPVPSLITSLLPNFVPLQAPELGVFRNWGFLLHFAITLCLMKFGSVFQIREPNKISHADLSNRDAQAIAVIGTAMLTLVVAVLGHAWRFPIPFIWVVAYPIYCVTLTAGHVIVLRDKVRRGSTIGGALLSFAPVYILQSMQVVAYTSFSALFELANEWEQLALMLVFPLLKLFFRHASYKLLKHLTEDATEVAVTGVEICAVMYQSTIMRNVPSLYTTAVLIGLDVGHGLLSIYLFMEKQSSVPRADLVGSAMELLRKDAEMFSDAGLIPYASTPYGPSVEGVNRFRAFSRAIVHPTATVSTPPRQDQLGPSSPTSGDNKHLLLTQALEVAQAAESILLAEYVEISIPLVNAIFFVVASQLESAIYNPKIRPYFLDHALLPPAVFSLGLYTLMQALSLVLMQIVMWHRYRVSALTLLAFVLERHIWSIQGKLITWLALFFQFSVMHYGVDFSFDFKYVV